MFYLRVFEPFGCFIIEFSGISMLVISLLHLTFVQFRVPLDEVGRDSMISTFYMPRLASEQGQISPCPHMVLARWLMEAHQLSKSCNLPQKEHHHHSQARFFEKCTFCPLKNEYEIKNTKFFSSNSCTFYLDTHRNICPVGNFICGNGRGDIFIFEMENLKYEEAILFCEKKNYFLCW